MLFDVRLPNLGLLNDHYLLIGSKVNSRKKGCWAEGKSMAKSGCLKLDLEAIFNIWKTWAEVSYTGSIRSFLVQVFS